MSPDFVHDCSLCGRRLPAKVPRGAAPVLCAPCAAPRRSAKAGGDPDEADEAEPGDGPGRRVRGRARGGAGRSSDRLRPPSSESGAVRGRRAPPPARPGSGPRVNPAGAAILAVLLAVALGYSLTSGRARHDSGYDRIERGMSRAQVLSLMGEPDAVIRLGQIESLAYEDGGGRRGHAVFNVVLDQGRVVDRTRTSESRTQFKRVERGW